MASIRKALSNPEAGTTTYGYDNVGNLQSVTYPNGVVHAYSYDTRNRLTNLGVTKGTNNLANYGYTLDAAGHRTQVTEQSGRTVNYTYDNLYRPTNETVAADPANVNGAVTYTYDAAGNLTTSPGAGTVTFDAENHLIAAGGQSYAYDGDGNRLWKAPVATPNSATFIYWYGGSGNVLQESDGAGNGQYSHIYFNGRRIKRVEWLNGGWFDHYAYDHLGNVRWLISNNGAWSVSDFYPFGGERILQSGTTNNTRKFTGKERDSESGLDNFGARFDSSTLGRFMSPDDFLKDSHVGDPRSWNKYAYARNNPLKYVDPTGEQATVSTSCTTDSNNHTTCNVNITASIAIYAASGNITQGQLDDAAKQLTNSIDSSWSGSFPKDGVTYNVSTQVSVSVAGSENEAINSGAQNVIGLVRGSLTNPQTGKEVGGFINPKGLGDKLIGLDTGMLNIAQLDAGSHEFTHMLGTDDKPGTVLSNTNPGGEPLNGKATSQDFAWGIQEVTSSVNRWVQAPSFIGMLPKGSTFSDRTTVGAPWIGWWK